MWAVLYPLRHLSHKGSCSCCCLMGHLNHVERSRFWFRVGGCSVFNPGSLFQLPPSTCCDGDFTCFSIPEIAGPDPSCAWCRCPLYGTFCACQTPGTQRGCNPQRWACAVCGGSRCEAREGNSLTPSLPSPHQPGPRRVPQEWAHPMGWFHSSTRFKLPFHCVAASHTSRNG